MAKRTVAGKDVTADKICTALVDRLIKLEKRCDSLTKEVNDLTDMVSENAAWLTAEGKLKFSNVMLEGSESIDSVSVTVEPLAGDLVREFIAAQSRKATP